MGRGKLFADVVFPSFVLGMEKRLKHSLDAMVPRDIGDVNQKLGTSAPLMPLNAALERIAARTTTGEGLHPFSKAIRGNGHLPFYRGSLKKRARVSVDELQAQEKAKQAQADMIRAAAELEAGKDVEDESSSSPSKEARSAVAKLSQETEGSDASSEDIPNSDVDARVAATWRRRMDAVGGRWKANREAVTHKSPRVTTISTDDAATAAPDLLDILQGCDPKVYLNQQVLLEGRYTLNWVIEESQTISVCISVNATDKLGWIGFGLRDPSSGPGQTMVHADLILGRYLNGTWDVTDYWSDGGSPDMIRPDVDRGGKNSVTRTAGGRAGTFGILKFSRALDTKDTWDWPISLTSATRMMAAFSDSGRDDISPHSSNSRHNYRIAFGKLPTTTTLTTVAATSTTTTTTTTQPTTLVEPTAKPDNTPTPSKETAPPILTAPGTQQPASTDPQLWVAFSVFRGGVRTPVTALPGTAKDWEGQGIPVGFNRLTQEGLAQMISLGKMLGTFYGSLITPAQTGVPDSGLVSMRATDHPWSMMSAQAVLRGMFPESWIVKDSVPRVFPIKVNVDQDDLLLLAPRNCPLYQYDLSMAIQSEKNPPWKALQDRAAALLSHFKFMYAIPPLTAMDISLKNWNFFYDPVECYRGNKMPPPKNLSEAKMVQVLQIGDALERISYPTNDGGLLGGNLMQSILGTMRLAMNASWDAATPLWKRSPKLHLFAGHKETLSALLAVLNQTIDKVPAFGDRIDLELIWDPKVKGFFVRVRSNGDRILEVCTGEKLCPFEKFHAAMVAQFKTDWGLTCQRRESIQCLQDLRANNGDAGDDVLFVLSPINSVWYLSTGVAVLLVAGLAILVFWKWRRRAQSDDVPEEIPLQPMKSRPRPKQFTLE